MATTPPGEPRGPRVDTVETVFTYAFRILIAEGAHALTPQRLHRESGIARTTIYRNWPETRDLIAAMLAKATGDQDVAPFVGAHPDDLRAAVASLIFRFNHRPVRPLFAALVEHSRGSDEDIAAEYVDGIVRPVGRALREAAARGDLEVDDPDAAANDLVAPLLMRHVILGQAVSEADGDALVDAFVAGRVG
ncbi:MAG: TetR-like C-terminal domain-containing protein [Actinomycetota bacterium]